MKLKFLDAISSSVVGLWVGIVSGLSTSPVVSLLLGLAGTLLPTMIGFRRSAQESESATLSSVPQNVLIKILFFGLAGLFGILAGISIRAYDLLGPSPQHEVQRYLAAGCTLEEAKYLMVAGRSLSQQDSEEENGSPLMKMVPTHTRSSLFNKITGSNPDPETLRPREEIALEKTLENWQLQEHILWSKAANEVAAQPIEKQRAHAVSLWNVLSQLR